MIASPSEPNAPSRFQLSAAADAGERMARKRNDMVAQQIAARGIKDPVVLDAMRVVARDRFVPPQFEGDAYEDTPLPIGHGQTISQPFIVAAMTEALELGPRDRVLEIGTGSGYQAAVIAEIAAEVYTLEIIEPLAERARSTLASLGYRNVFLKLSDGYDGWADKAPFDAIIVTAAPERVPQTLLGQLAVDGRLVIPLGGENQTLYAFKKSPQGLTRREICAVRFVPMTGQVESLGRPDPLTGI